MAKWFGAFVGARRAISGLLAPVLTAATAGVVVTVGVVVVAGPAGAAGVPTAPPSTITLRTSASDLQAGQAATLTATTDVDIARSASVVHILDQTNSTTVATCTTGMSCTGSVALSVGGPHVYVATVDALTSNSVTIDRARWGISLTEDAPLFAAGHSVTLTATTNQDIDATGGNYAIYVFDQTAGTLLAHCDSGNTSSPTTSCTATSAFSTGDQHSYIAEVAATANPLPGSASDATDVQATSNQITASRQPWTVQLATDQTSYAPGQTATLTATVDQSLGATDGSYALYVFDQDTGQAIAYCTTGTSCTAPGTYNQTDPVTYVAKVARADGADVSLGQLGDVQASSNAVTVTASTWTVSLATPSTTFPAGGYAALTATANANTEPSGSAIYIIDLTTDSLMNTGQYSSQAEVDIDFLSGGPDTYVAEIARYTGGSVTKPEQLTNIQATSNPVTIGRAPWTISLASNEGTFQAGTSATLTATTNQAIGNTDNSYADYIFDLTTGNAVAYCRFSEDQCVHSDQVGSPGNFLSGGPHSYIALVATDAGSSITYGQATNVQAISNTIELSREAWTLSVTATNNRSYQTVVSAAANQDVGLTFGAYEILMIDETTGSVLLAQQSGAGAGVTFSFSSPVTEVYAVVAHYDSTTGAYSDVQAISNGVIAPTPSPTLLASELFGGSNPAENGCAICEGDPVSTATGEYTNSSADLGIPGVGPGLLINRTYSSAVASTNGPFGYGWSFNYSSHLTFSGGSSADPLPRTVTVTQENQSTVTFLEDPTQHYVAAPRVLATLTYDSGSQQWTYTRRARQILVFDVSGRLVKLRDTNGNTVNLTYDGSGQLSTAAAGGARSLSLTWSGGHISSVTDSAGLTASYTYDGAGNLATVTAVDGGVTSYGYDSSHRLTTLTTPRGAVTTNSYDSTGRTISQTDPDQRTTTFSYSGTFPNYTTTTTAPDGSKTVATYSSGRLSSQTLGYGTAAAATWEYSYDVENDIASVTDPTGAVQSYTYDARGNKLTSTDPLSDVSSWTYDSLDDVLTATDGAGRTSTSTYDPHGNLLTLTSPMGHTQTFTYNPNGTKASYTDARGNTTTYSYDSAGDLTSITDPDSRTTSYSYDPAGNVITDTDSAGKQTTSTYDAANRLLSVTDANNDTTLYSYDADGHRTAVTDPLGRTTTYTYDLAGQRTSSTDPAGDKTTYSYTGAGLLASITDSDNHVQTFGYDARGDKTSATDADHRTTTYLYDGDGRLLSTTTPAGAVTKASYNAAGEVTTSTDANGNITDHTYNGAGQRLTSTDPLGRQTATTYNLDGRPTTTTYPDRTTATYGYNADGDLTSYTNPDGLQTTYSYDAAGLETGRTTPGNETTTYSYDAAGRLQVTTSPSGATETRNYDAAGQLTQKVYSRADTPTVSYAYNGAGQRTSMTDGTGTTTYSYDDAGRLSSTIDGAGNTVSYTYDPTSLLTKLTYPGGQAVTYSYDPANQLTSVTDWAGRTTSFGYNPDGHLVSQQDPNGITESWTRNPVGAPTGITLSNDTTTLASLSYGYDAANELTSDTDILGNTRTYSYDPHAQLATASVTDSTGAQTSYSYAASPGGQLTSTDTISLGYNTVGQPSTATSLTTPLSTTSYAYDLDGNRTSAQTGTNIALTYTYDTTGSLTSASTPDGSTVNYTYNGDSLRESRQVGSTTTQFTWATVHDLPVTLDDGTDRYIYGPTDTPIAQISDTDDSIEYLHPDGTGNIAAITDNTGTLVGRTAYDPYGAVTSHDGTATSKYGFAGEWTDPATGLVYLRARDYDPTTGQFLTPDPAFDQTRQEYEYADNNPLSNRDPTGLCDNVFCDFGKAALGDAASFVDGAANTATFGLVNHVVDLVDPGATCQLTHNGFYLAGSIFGAAATGLATGGTSALADTGELTLNELADASLQRVEQSVTNAAEDVGAGTSVFRTPHLGDAESELGSGLNPANHVSGDRSAYLGSESVARDFANPKVGGYENGYVRYDMHSTFEQEFAPYRFRYDQQGADRWEYQIPVDLIDRFNQLTLNRTWISW